ncbi:SPOR domain-containing protein [Sphingomonas histidinilytica]|uniref:SPOR domain-containing protein n=1 Tax=Rhizorhabdus histidinilytica TaxID=439228 RepID=UPI001AD97F1A|nr:SPOR domain-containing protein [Rhizorhabdus histidinilytica]MBO9376572.1 SPOR domain-containing protein [Rhizorhabdus histidinilytica]
MRTTGTRTAAAWTAAIATALLLAGCGRKAVKTVSTPPLKAATPRPQPPSGATENFRLPDGDGNGGYRTVNAGVSDTEAVWHLRSALNVAALSCDRTGKTGITANYNKMLGHQRKALAAAYKAEGARFGSASATDAHVTQVYNFFAQPPAQARFCAVATGVAAEAAALPAEKLPGFAPGALDRLAAPFSEFYDAYARYKVELAAWEKGDHGPARAATAFAMAPAAATVATAAVPSGPPWRIQLGAYSGDRAARDAWTRIRQRMKGAADFEPRYEEVPASRLVRVRIGPVTDRAQAIALCAAAAGAGLDCLPVPPRA